MHRGLRTASERRQPFFGDLLGRLRGLLCSLAERDPWLLLRISKQRLKSANLVDSHVLTYISCEKEQLMALGNRKQYCSS